MLNSKTIRRLPVLMLLMALVPVSLAAQSAEERIQDLIDQAAEADIPTALLENKVAEGVAKGVPADRIAEAVARRLDGLTRAQQALAGVPDVQDGDIEVSADALESGVDGEALAELVRTAPREARATAIVALTYLVNEAGVASQEALDAVEDAMARGPEALQNLPAQARGPGSVETPVGPPDDVPAGGAPAEAGPPEGVPAPGDAPGGARPDGAGPPSDGLPGAGGPPGF